MANRQRGEVDLLVDGRTYTLRMDLNALAEAETALSADGGKPLSFQEALKGAERGGLREMRALLWGGLRAHHPHLKLSDAGGMLTEMSQITTQLTEALKHSLPDTNGNGAGSGNPPARRKRGRG